MKVLLAQLNPVVGDMPGNIRLIKETLFKATSGVDLAVFPELFITGYPPRDLLEQDSFIRKSEEAVKEVVKLSKKYAGAGILFGAPARKKDALYNSALLAYRGKLIFTQHKSLLPTYDVFDEARYFKPAPKVGVVRFKGEVLGVSICEDAWNDPQMWGRRKYSFDPISTLAKKGATVLINLSASPFHLDKEKVRFSLISNHARRHGLPFLFVNQVGANDELIFDGRSMSFDKSGNPTAVLPPFIECITQVDTKAKGQKILYIPQNRILSLRQALVLGLRDYMRKCGFKKAVLGLSGGVDSAVTACLAAEAVGAENVLGVAMPGPYSSKHSLDDAQKLAAKLGTHFTVIPINGVYDAYLAALDKAFKGKKRNEAEENIQARIRGNILMALSNKYGHLVLSTGNKSELAVGYCTLYGDMSGGLAVISDVPKTMIYELAKNINRRTEVIPESSITKAPSAELRQNQTDQDTLPEYEVLDRILSYYIDDGMSAEEIARKRLNKATVEWVVEAVNRSEYKRRQAAPGLKVTTKAFGTGRRMPIAAKKPI